jgi:hypothetical protein
MVEDIRQNKNCISAPKNKNRHWLSHTRIRYRTKIQRLGLCSEEQWCIGTRASASAGLLWARTSCDTKHPLGFIFIICANYLVPECTCKCSFGSELLSIKIFWIHLSWTGVEMFILLLHSTCKEFCSLGLRVCSVLSSWRLFPLFTKKDIFRMAWY